VLRVIKFVFVSGLGFFIDFVLYSILIRLINLDIFVISLFTSLVGVTFVFFTSTKKVFENNTANIPLKYKYLIYVIYQIILILVCSKIIVYLNGIFETSSVTLISKYSKELAKLCIPPVTLTINYFVMKKITKL
jgi:putative flippase GtrA